jgi:ATP-binding cassette, subfamily B, bacterial HlyB/CyaB
MSATASLVCVLLTPPLRKNIDERFRRGAEAQAFVVESNSRIQTLKAAAVEAQIQSLAK